MNDEPKADWLVMRAGDQPLYRFSSFGDIEILAQDEFLTRLWLDDHANIDTRAMALFCIALRSMKRRLDGDAGGIILPPNTKIQ